MTVSEAANKLSLECYSEGDQGREVKGGYSGDLLSWVIGRAGAGSAWITIMSNANVAAVALLAEVSMIILAEGVAPDDELFNRARQQGLALYSSPMGAYELSWRLHGLLEPGQGDAK